MQANIGPMSNLKIILAAAVLVSLASGCSNEDDDDNAAPDPQADRTGKQTITIAAMDPPARVKKPRQGESIVAVRFGGVDYSMEFSKPVYCGDFFGITAANFSAIKPVSGERVTRLTYNGNRDIFRFVFWRDTTPDRFDPADSDAHFTIEKKDGVVSGFEIIDGTRGADINAENIRNFVAEGSTLRYEGPFSAGSDTTITVDAVYCPQ